MIVEHLKFPSGLSVKRAKSLAKEKSKSLNISLVRALNSIAQEQVQMNWNTAIKRLEILESNRRITAPDLKSFEYLLMRLDYKTLYTISGKTSLLLVEKIY